MLNLVIERIFISDVKLINCRELSTVLCNSQVAGFGLSSSGMDCGSSSGHCGTAMFPWPVAGSKRTGAIRKGLWLSFDLELF